MYKSLILTFFAIMTRIQTSSVPDVLAKSIEVDLNIESKQGNCNGTSTSYKQINILHNYLLFYINPVTVYPPTSCILYFFWFLL